MSEYRGSPGSCPLNCGREFRRSLAGSLISNMSIWKPRSERFWRLLVTTAQGSPPLIKAISGIYRPDDGEILVDGQTPPLYQSSRCSSCGNRDRLFQDLALVECLDVSTNMFIIGQLPKKGWFVDRAR
jgi:ABC-type branched-subunit amino acid transport system ATPase component